MNTLSFERVPAKQARKAAQARDCADMVFTAQHRHIEIERMLEVWNDVRNDRAADVDRVTAENYEKDLEANHLDLLGRTKSRPYIAPPVRRHFIPKGDGTERSPGIPPLQDAVAQRTVLMVLEPICEEDFLPCQNGFRCGRSTHEAPSAPRAELAGAGPARQFDPDLSKCLGNADKGQPVRPARPTDQRWRDLGLGLQSDGLASTARGGS